MNKKSLFVAAALAIVAGVFLVRGRVPFVGVDGIALNNPGLIEIDPDRQLLGEIRPSSNSRYAEFLGPSLGVYAIAKKLQAVGGGVLSLREVITAYAQARGENPTSYVKQISEISGLPELATTSGQMQRIIEAIIVRESGSNPYDALTIQQGVNMLLVNGWN